VLMKWCMKSANKMPLSEKIINELVLK